MKKLLIILCCGLLFACEPHGRIGQMKSPIVVVAVGTGDGYEPIILKDSTGQLFSFGAGTNIASSISGSYADGKIEIGDTLQ